MTRAGQWRLWLAVGAALALSLSLKAVGIAQLAAHDEPRFVRDLATALRTQGYAVETGTGNWWSAGLVTARKGRCTLQLRSAAVYGQDREAVTRRRMTAGALRYYYAGTDSTEYPRFRSEFAWRIQRELGRIGVPLGVHPAIAVAATSQCAPDPRWLEPVRLYLRAA